MQDELSWTMLGLHAWIESQIASCWIQHLLGTLDQVFYLLQVIYFGLHMLFDLRFFRRQTSSDFCL